MLDAKIRIYGHPRSGNHYLLKLLKDNFISSKDRGAIKHKLPDDQVTINDINSDAIIFFIHRDTDAIIDSVFQMRHRYTFNENDYEKFKSVKISTMYNKEKAKCLVRADSYAIDATIKDTNDPYFGKFKHMTIREEIEYFNGLWLPFAKEKGIPIIRYEDLLTDFNSTMLSIAKHLNSDKTEFTDIDTRIGLFTLNPDGSEMDWKKVK